MAYPAPQYPSGFDELFSLLDDKHQIVLFNGHRSWKLERAATLSMMLESNKYLTVLDLADNSIGIEGIQLMMGALCLNKTLSLLDLTNNKLNTDAGLCIARTILLRNTSIKTLYLENNAMIGDKGWIEIFKAMRKNNSITDLNCAQNAMSDDEILELATALHTNRVLTTLSLRDNRFGVKGAKAILKSLEKNFTLSTLWLRANNIDQELADEIQQKLASNVDYQRQAFYKTLKSEKKGPWHRSRLMVVGEGMVGKTATVRSLLNLEFEPSWESTIGISLSEAKASRKGVWTGSLGVQSSTADCLTQFAAKVTVVNLEESKQQSPEILAEDEAPPQVVATAAAVAVTNNNRDDRREVITTMARRRIKEEEMVKGLLVEARNDKGGINLSIWDYGGQTVFYTMHHLFLTRYGIYLLCFDMRTMLRNSKSSVEQVKFWLNSVNMHAPDAPILMVGTFMEDLKSSAAYERVDSQIYDLVEKFPQVMMDDESGMSFFPIDNKTQAGLLELRKKVETVTRGQDFVNLQVSIQWMRCLEKIQAQEDRSWLTLKEVNAKAKEVGIVSLPQVLRMLSLFHEFGMIVHFTKSEILRDVITTNPQWLVNAISKVIRDDRIHQFDLVKIITVGLKNDVRDLFVYGLVSRDLLDYLWEASKVEFLLDLMRNLLLISTWNYGDQEMYLVPSMLNRSGVIGEDRGLELRIDFSEFFLPNGVFERLICYCVAHSALQKATKEPELKVNMAQIWFSEDMSLSLTHKQEHISVHVEDESHAPFCLDLIQSCMRKIRSEIMGTGLKFSLLVEVNDKLLLLEKARMKRNCPWWGESAMRENSLAVVTIENFMS